MSRLTVANGETEQLIGVDATPEFLALSTDNPIRIGPSEGAARRGIKYPELDMGVLNATPKNPIWVFAPSGDVTISFTREAYIEDLKKSSGAGIPITWAYLSNHQDITAGKTQNVKLDATETNDLNFDTSSVTFTLDDAGYYLIQAQVYWFETDNDSEYGMEVREQISNLNTEDIISSATRTGAGANSEDVSVGASGMVSLDGNNELRLVARNEGSNDRQLLGAKANTYLRIARLGDRL